MLLNYINIKLKNNSKTINLTPLPLTTPLLTTPPPPTTYQGTNGEGGV